MDKSDSNKVFEDKALKGHEESSVLARRRLLKTSVLAAPVLASLSSRPVLAGACLSNILSGNLSNANGGNCSLGWSPGAWKNPGGTISSYGTREAWALALGYSVDDTGMNAAYGAHVDGQCPPPGPPCACYTGGATLADVGLSCIASSYSISSDTPLRQILCDNDSSEASHCVAAFLNASLSANDPSFTYILTVGDVIDLCCNGMAPPGGMSLNDFLDSTWQ